MDLTAQAPANTGFVPASAGEQAQPAAAHVAVTPIVADGAPIIGDAAATVNTPVAAAPAASDAANIATAPITAMPAATVTTPVAAGVFDAADNNQATLNRAADFLAKQQPEPNGVPVVYSLETEDGSRKVTLAQNWEISLTKEQAAQLDALTAAIDPATGNPAYKDERMVATQIALTTLLADGASVERITQNVPAMKHELSTYDGTQHAIGIRGLIDNLKALAQSEPQQALSQPEAAALPAAGAAQAGATPDALAAALATPLPTAAELQNASTPAQSALQAPGTFVAPVTGATLGVAQRQAQQDGSRLLA